jgi:hypothetical protein
MTTMTFSIIFFKKAFSSFLCKVSEKMEKPLVRPLGQPLVRPLGRWSHCGDKKYVEDIVEFKIRQKQRRQYLLETGIDPYHVSLHPPQSPLKIEEEEYMYPYIVQH